jgi:hypothetical protein
MRGEFQKEHDLEIYSELTVSTRWSNSQKTRLIESILLGIPIPQIFVSQL